MSTLLHVDSSPLGAASITRRLTAEYVNSWTKAHPGGEVIRRDLAQMMIPALNGEWVQAIHTGPEAQTDSQRELLQLSDTLIGELESADEWVFGVPMHNFTVAASFRLWLDQVLRAGKTFTYASGTPAGLLKNKKAHFFTASGGVYSVGSPTAAMDFVEPYLRAVFGFIGITDVTFQNAGGAAAVAMGKVDRQLFLEPHLQVIRNEFQPA